ncbi:MAG: hypothetical protein NTZ32_10550 [Planctomycetales bacterium]|nr:hypothetical protein [Planctomycetales bacterium]
MLLGENVDHTAIAQFTDEGKTGQVFQPLGMRDGRSQSIRMAVLLQQGIARCGRQQDQDKVSGWKIEENVFGELSVLSKSDASVSDALVRTLPPQEAAQ